MFSGKWPILYYIILCYFSITSDSQLSVFRLSFFGLIFFLAHLDFLHISLVELLSTLPNTAGEVWYFGATSWPILYESCSDQEDISHSVFTLFFHCGHLHETMPSLVWERQTSLAPQLQKCQWRYHTMRHPHFSFRLCFYEED